MKDHVESALYKAALAGEGWAVCFFLKTQARNRGYIEKVAVGVPAVPDSEADAALEREMIKYIRVHCSHCSANGDNGQATSDGSPIVHDGRKKG